MRNTMTEPTTPTPSRLVFPERDSGSATIPAEHLADFEVLRQALTRAARGPTEDFARVLAAALIDLRVELGRLEKCDLALLAQVTAQRLEGLEARLVAVEARVAAIILELNALPDASRSRSATAEAGR
jgi:hypothetical protein